MRYISLSFLLLTLLVAFSVRAQIENPGAGEGVGTIGPYNPTAGGPPPPGCAGAIDLSAGCALPMLAGAP